MECFPIPYYDFSPTPIDKPFTMTSDFHFEKKSIVILISGTFVLAILVFFLGMLIGLSIERPASKTGESQKVTVEEPKSEGRIEAGKHDPSQTSLAKETESKPVNPEFKQVSPKAEIPPISKPKTE